MGERSDLHCGVCYLEILFRVIKLWDKRSLSEVFHTFEAPKKLGKPLVKITLIIQSVKT